MNFVGEEELKKGVRSFSPVFRKPFRAISHGSNTPKHFTRRIKLKAYAVENGQVLVCKLFRNYKYTNNMNRRYNKGTKVENVASRVSKMRIGTQYFINQVKWTK